uniref:Tectonin beta-propeller repeat containing 2 n=1 Tax=Eptatretus burgeri TaxID=7764 RepID=A0A8C4Q3J5_EPTBU
MSFSALSLRECDAPCSTLKLLPTWSHRGLCSVPLRLTAMDVNTVYVALGSSGGTLFVHYRAHREMRRFELRSEPITAVKLLCCLDDLVAVGTSYGAVVLLQLHSPVSEQQSQLQRFEVLGQHCGSVSALTWAANGMKLFSGDEQGRVACTLVDWDQGVCNSSLVHEEPSAVIQLDYAQRTLLVATAQRAVLCRPGQRDPPLQVGTKQRKSSGRFGACFNPGWCTPAEQMLFASRPGLRMWLSDTHGAVKATYMFRSVLESDPKTIPLLTLSPMISSPPITERQLGLLCPFTQGLVLSWNEHALYVLDPQKQAVVGSLEGLPAIVTVASSEDEIFVLHRNREIICIASAPVELMKVRGVDGILEVDEVEHREVEASKTLWQVCEPCAETLQQFPVPLPLIPADISQEMPKVAFCSDWHEETDEFKIGKASKSESLPCCHMVCHNSGSKLEMALSAEDESDTLNDPQVPHSSSFEEHHTECYSVVADDGTMLKPLVEENLEKDSVAENALHAVPVDKVSCEIDATPANYLLPGIAAVAELTVDALAEKMNEHAIIDHEEESSDDDLDIYAGGIHESSSDASFTETTTAVDWEPKVADKVGLMIECSSSELLPSDDEGAAESWVVYASPSPTVACLAASDRHLWCVDRRGGLFCCPISSPDPTGLRWNKYEEGVTQVAVSPSGALLWRVDAESGRVLACSKGSGWSRCHWFEASLSPTAHIALSEGSGWIVGTDGQVWLQPGLSGERPCSHGVQVAGCPLLAQIAVRGSVVWALTFDPALPLLYREGVSSLCPQGERWLPDSISLQQGVQPVSLALGDVHLLWMVDTNGQVWFRRGVTPDHPAGEDDHWWQVCIWDKRLFVHRQKGEKLGSGSRVSPNCLVPRGTTASSTWVKVLVSPLPEEDGVRVWVMQNTGEIFSFIAERSGNHPLSVPCPPSADETLALSVGRSALWAIERNGVVFIRPLSSLDPTGATWHTLDLSQLAGIRLVSVACGTETVWACDTTGMVYFRIGTQPLNPSNMLPAWVSLEPPSQGAPLCKLACSVDDKHVWALDARGGVFVRNGISDTFPIGANWEFLADLAVSSTTTWLLLPGGDIARRVGIRAINHAGDYWRRMPGCLSAITVNETDEVWGVNPNGSLLRRLTCTIRFPKDREEQSSPWPSARLEGLHCHDILGDDWEVL